MSNKRYLEFDSTYRNRKEYPLPSVFNVLLGQSGTRNASTAYDPVSAAAPLITWVPNQLILSGGSIDLPANAPLNTTSVFTIKFLTTAGANTTPDYYIGSPIQVASPSSQTVIIKSWNALSLGVAGFDYFVVSVSPSFSVIPSGAVTFLPNATNLTVGSFLIPNGADLNNYYVEYLIYNENLNQYKTIISYDASQRLACIGPLTGWALSHTYTLRKAPPQFTGILDTTIPPIFINTTTSFFVPLNTIVSVGDFIRFTGGPHANLSCRVISLGIIKSIPPDPAFNSLSVTVDCILNPIPVSGTTFEVLQFTRDNAVPFCYTGSLVSQQEMVCYEIRLTNLVIPNKLLKSGGRITSYPYVYVELQNVSASSAGTKCVIYSNNPHSPKMLFKAVISYRENHDILPYIQFTGGDMTQTVKFKPNDSLKFGVYLPDGRPVETIDKDYFSPLQSNPFVQVSATFEIMRL